MVKNDQMILRRGYLIWMNVKLYKLMVHSIHQHVEGKQKLQWHEINFEPRYQGVIETKSSSYINTSRPMMLRRREASDQPYAVVVSHNLK